MPGIKKLCKKCRKGVELIRECQFGDRLIKVYSCGHMEAPEKLSGKISYATTSATGKTLYKFQEDTVQFVIEKSQGRALIAHEMGLGKAVITAAILKQKPDIFTPCVGVFKSATVRQMFIEFLDWMNEDMSMPVMIPQMITSGSDIPIPGMAIYIVSYDLLDKMLPHFQKMKIKCAIIDECQAIKNGAAKRTVAVRKLCESTPYVIATSGTPIKNHAAEYFPILNILRPDTFRKYEWFVREWVDVYQDKDRGAWHYGGLNRHRESSFRSLTENFITRKTRDEVDMDLPKVRRSQIYNDLGINVTDAYNRVMKDFLNEMDDFDSSSIKQWSNVLSYMSKMRHLTGLSKVDPAVDFCADFLDSTDRKLTVFVHHQDVAFAMKQKLTDLCSGTGVNVLSFSSDLTSEARSDVIQRFWKDGSARILIASTLAAGEGLNLQICSDALMMERQWNPANEEQAEARFTRKRDQATIALLGKAESVNVTYMVATGTIDEFFAELVEKKRAHFQQTMDGVESNWQETSIMRELADILHRNGRKRWAAK